MFDKIKQHDILDRNNHQVPGPLPERESVAGGDQRDGRS